MASNIQILSLLASFIYGVIFYLLTRFNYFIIESKKLLTKFMVTLVFIIDIVILYVYLMYKINNGYFHIYFVFMLILGYILMYKCYNSIKVFCKNSVKKIKKK